MKKFLYFSIVIFLVVILGWSFIEKVACLRDEVTSFSRVEDKNILVNDEKFTLKGINISSVEPGGFTGDFKASEEDYLRWFGYIDDLKVNSLRVSGLMDADFYNALYEFNSRREKPIYLLQGISFNDEYINDGFGLQSETVTKDMEDEIKKVIDAIHGNKEPFLTSNSDEIYSKDVSNYVIGYTLGNGLAYNDVIYSELMNTLGDFKGKYVYSKDGASDTEKYIAYLADYIVSYESNTYKSQRLISFVASDKDSINSEAGIKDRTLKRYVDIEKLGTTEELKSGLFVSYNVSILKDEFTRESQNIYEYFKELNEVHTIPVVISEYSVPSARMAGDFIRDEEKGYITEKEQGELLLEGYKAIKESGCAGSFLFEWQDCWYRSSWNTKELVTLDKSAYWSNAQVYSQNFGLLAFDPGKEKSISYPDNTIEEWDLDDIVSESEDVSLSMKSDEKYLYFMAKFNESIGDEDRLFIDLNITPKSGSKINSELGLEFEEEADFIISLGKNIQSELLVHEYYDSYKFIENTKKLKVNPNDIDVQKNGEGFSVVRLHSRERTYSEITNSFKEAKAYETGRLILGNGNPNSQEFNSISDYFIGEDYIEIRVPWALLNFKDPTTKTIHDDYYSTFGFEGLVIDAISVGVTLKSGDESHRVSSAKYELSGWTMPKYHERLKESYYIIKEEFSKS
ncbi:hypothetical protein [Clostridium sp. B9]|uniref:hypothetical protein n=1 Tax=Clostridium sp. B9 TaxID=3423224 RepID=UPI003D2F3114